MAFTPNPLALSVPEPAFESWLRDSGYLEILDQRTSMTASASSNTNPSESISNPIIPTNGFFVSLFSHLVTTFSLFTVNPFAKLTAEDFAGETPPWSHSFIGYFDSYSFPSSPSQARMRVHENLKRYARNYASLGILFFVCTLYKMPLALLGLISCLATWDAFKFCSEKWGLDRYPVIRQCLVRIAQCASAVILIFSNVQMALFYAISISYVGMIFHAAFRKLTASKQTSKRRGR